MAIIDRRLQVMTKLYYISKASSQFLFVTSTPNNKMVSQLLLIIISYVLKAQSSFVVKTVLPLN